MLLKEVVLSDKTILGYYETLNGAAWYVRHPLWGDRREGATHDQIMEAQTILKERKKEDEQ